MKRIRIAAIATKGGTGKSTLIEAFRQYLPSSEIVDLDHQKTLTLASKLAKRPLPINEEEAKAQYLLYDTPPYNEHHTRILMAKVNHIVIPVKIGYPDLLALKTVYDGLLSRQAMKKAILVFNEVRRPLTNEAKEIIKCFKQSYPLLKMAETQISKLDVFRGIFRRNLEGKGLQQIDSLFKELNIFRGI